MLCLSSCVTHDIRDKSDKMLSHFLFVALCLVIIFCTVLKSADANCVHGFDDMTYEPFGKGWYDRSCATSNTTCEHCGLYSLATCCCSYQYSPSYYYLGWEDPWYSGYTKEMYEVCSPEEEEGCMIEGCCASSKADCAEAKANVADTSNADGMCDSFNNNYPTYDGGDCCANTCTPGSRPWPCGVFGYDCRDPSVESDQSLPLSDNELLNYGFNKTDDTWNLINDLVFGEDRLVINITASIINIDRLFGCELQSCSIFLKASRSINLGPNSNLFASTILIHSPNVTLQGTLDVNARGFRGDMGPGRGQLQDSVSGRPGGGGGYGSVGGCANQCDSTDTCSVDYGYFGGGSISGGPVYGDLHRPLCYGSGGGSGYYLSMDYENCPLGSDCAPTYFNDGGHGGGRIAIISKKVVIANSALLTANGEDAKTLTPESVSNRRAFSGGGGSGGSIFIRSKNIEFENSIAEQTIFSATGGIAYTNEYYICDDENEVHTNGYGGAGGGGRISLLTLTDVTSIPKNIYNVTSGVHIEVNSYNDNTRRMINNGTVYIGSGCAEEGSVVHDDEVSNESSSDSHWYEMSTKEMIIISASTVGSFIILLCCCVYCCRKQNDTNGLDKVSKITP